MVIETRNYDEVIKPSVPIVDVYRNYWFHYLIYRSKRKRFTP